MKLKIAICDDEARQRTQLANKCEQWAHSARCALTIKAFESAEAFLFEYHADKGYDILLLDIQMDKINGVELAKKIRESDESVQIVFITGYPDFATAGYEVSALHYLMKPVSDKRLFAVLEKAALRLKTREKALLLSNGGESVRLPLYDIETLEAQGHYVKITCGKVQYTFKINLTEIAQRLDNSFFRCHRSYIININYIKKISRTEVYLTAGTQVPLARGLYESLNDALINYFK